MLDGVRQRDVHIAASPMSLLPGVAIQGKLGPDDEANLQA